MRVLLLGGTGHLGRDLLPILLQREYTVVALVRNPDKVALQAKNLEVIKGDPTQKQDLEKAVGNVDAVISTLGHGFRTSFPIQEKTLTCLIPLMEKKKIQRFITITGAGLKVKGDPHSFIADMSEVAFNIVDPYRMSDAKKQQELLEKSHLEWTVVRTPIHSDKKKSPTLHIGFTQPQPWDTISRENICEFMLECLEENTYLRQSPIIY